MRQLQVPGYQVWGLLGEGGMSEVWLAKHEVLAAPVIVKTLRQTLRENDDHAAAARILSEARLMARVSSTRIVRVLDAGELEAAPSHPALPFLVQEYVDGLDLAELDRRRRTALGVGLPLWMVCHVMRETCMALRSAHQAGVIHRDLKPSNVFGEPENGIRLGDFGIAVARSDAARSEKSSAGTLPFMAPEQLRGAAEIGRFTDVWGAAATACDLRYGRSPFDSVAQILDALMPPALPPPTSPAEAYFQDVLRRMLAKDFRERPQDILGPLAHFTMLARSLEPALLLTSRQRDSLQLGQTRVTFKVGDIADAEADAIVSSANFEMKMRTGVGEALRLRGGDVLEEEAMSGGEQALGSCLRTTAGKLRAKHVFHAVSAWNEVSCVGRSFTRALLLSEENGCTTLAAPALGTGVARVSLEACANAMLTTLRWHLMLGGSRLRELTIVLNTDAKRRLFQEVAEEVLGISKWRHLPADLGLPDDRSVVPDGTSPTFLDPHQA